MKKLSTLMVFTICFCHISHAQVKRQYKDESFAQTTIVIKEEYASDVDILNSQFDMDDIGMGEVIRITTEQVQARTEVPVKPATEAKPSIPETIYPQKQEVVETKVIENPETQNVSKSLGEKQALEKIYKTTYSKPARASSGIIKEYTRPKSKLFKPKKRKNHSKRNKQKCYKF